MFQAHRLAWLYVYGVWPKNQIDHINRVTLDNRIVNLRQVTLAENKQNRKSANSNNKTGILGVSYNNRQKKFIASIAINKKFIHLGTFNSKELAHSAYLAAKRELHHFGEI